MSRARFGTLAAVLGAALALAPPAHALRVVTWNLFAYSDPNIAARQPYFRTVMANIAADVLIAQELDSDAGRDSFLTNVLNVVEPGQWASSNFFALQTSPTTEGGAVFYKPAKVGISFTSQFATSGPRDVLLTRVTPVGYTNINGTFRVYSIHLKAGGPATVDSTTRRLECTDIRNTLNLAPANTNFLIGGDTNFYSADEGGYIRLTESQTDNDGRCKDPLAMPGNWHLVSAYSPYFSQCPCNTGCGAGFSGGGLDDRFDLILSSLVMQNGEGVDVVPGGYFAYGNDGNHFNDDVNGGGFNTAVGLAIATALHNASDHLPVVCTVQVASKIAAESQIDFGTVIAGATANQTLHVTDSATAPADDLDYTLGAPAGFTAPGGPFSALAGNTNFHTIGMSTASIGTKSGTLAVSTDAPDSLTKNVLLSGKVVGHASPSLDSTVFVPGSTLDLGNVETGGFRDSTVAVHNRGYNGLQARLSVNSGTITGGAGRFTIVGGFTPSLVSVPGQRYTIHFDDLGATKDSTYEADLTFATSDEPLPGAITLSALAVHLVARPKQVVDVPGAGASALRFYAPRPNPLARETRFAFDLPHEAPVSLEVFDLNGRRVADVVSGVQPAGHHEAPWRAADARGGRLAAGLYFARFVTPGLAESRRLVLLP